MNKTGLSLAAHALAICMVEVRGMKVEVPKNIRKELEELLK